MALSTLDRRANHARKRQRKHCSFSLRAHCASFKRPGKFQERLPGGDLQPGAPGSYWGPKEYTPKAIEEWLRIYRKEGFDGLKPKLRSDKGKSRSIPPELQESILELRREKRDLPVSLFYELLTHKAVIRKTDFSYATVYRLLKRHALAGKQQRSEPKRKRFAYETVNILWQADGTQGPYLKVKGKKRPTFLLAFLDDCSRVVPAARFSFTEKTEDLMKVLRKRFLGAVYPR